MYSDQGPKPLARHATSDDKQCASTWARWGRVIATRACAGERQQEIKVVNKYAEKRLAVLFAAYRDPA